MKHRGFTLAEVLIALALLGVIATFTVPKVLQSTGDVEKKAVLRETLAVLQSELYEGLLTGDLYTSGSLYNYLKTNFNTIKTCDTNFNTLGCYTGANPANNANEGGLVLPSGATIADIGTLDISVCKAGNLPNLCADGMWMDYNGSKPPNVAGQDRIWVSINLNTTPEAVAGDGISRGPATAFVTPLSVDSYPLYQQLLQ